MIRPLEDRVVIQMEEEPEKTKSGIILNANSKEKPQTGVVIEIGPGVKVDGKLEPVNVKKGDRVILNKYAGTEVKYEGNEYIIVRDNDILAIVEEEN